MQFFAFIFCLYITLKMARKRKASLSTIKYVDHPSYSHGRRNQADHQIASEKSSMTFWVRFTVGSWLGFICYICFIHFF
jgi:hypothetical protein